LEQPKYFSTSSPSSTSSIKTGGPAAFDALENPPSNDGQAHSISKLEMEKAEVKEALKKVEAEIEANKAVIEKLEKQIDEVVASKDREREKWLRQEKDKLLGKEDKLREKEDKLREKENLLVRQLGEAREPPLPTSTPEVAPPDAPKRIPLQWSKFKAKFARQLRKVYGDEIKDPKHALYYEVSDRPEQLLEVQRVQFPLLNKEFPVRLQDLDEYYPLYDRHQVVSPSTHVLSFNLDSTLVQLIP